jgi:hypothetical protein
MRTGVFFRYVVVLVALVFMASLAQAQESNPLAVPAVTLDRYGTFTVADCPTTHETLEVKLLENENRIDKIQIFAEGMLMQSLPIREEDAITRNEVHFLDANFDGNVDILIGPGCNREYSALIMWDNEENCWARATNDGFSIFNGDFFYDPSRMVVYRRTSSSAAETTYTMMIWQGTDLQSEETFLIIGDRSCYDSYHVTHRYTIRNYYSDEDIISTDNPNEIFNPWDRWINSDE